MKKPGIAALCMLLGSALALCAEKGPVIIYKAAAGDLVRLDRNQNVMVSDDFFEDGEVVKLRVDNALCGTQFRWYASEKSIPDADPGFRGLENAEGLIASVLPAPAAHGVVPLEALVIADRTVADLFQLLLSAEGAGEVEAELHSEQRAMQVTLTGLERKRKIYDRWLDKLTGLEGQARRFWLEDRTHTYSAGGILGDWEQLMLHRSQFIAETLGIHCKAPQSHRNCSAAAASSPPITCGKFQQRVDEVNEVLSRAASVRREIQTSPEAAYPRALEADLATFFLRLEAYRGKVERTQAAAQIARKVVKESGCARISVWNEPLLKLLHRLDQTYSLDDVTTAVLREISKESWRLTCNHLSKKLKEIADELESRSLQPAPGMKFPAGTLAELDERAMQLESESSELADRFEKKILALNQDLRATLRQLDQLHDRTARTVYAEAIGPWNGNHTVTVRVSQKRTFQLPDMTGLDKVVIEQGAASTTVVEPVEDFREVASTHFEVHKLRRFNVGGGVVLSSLDEQEFAIRSTPRLDEMGAQMLSAEGTVLLDPVLVSSGTDTQRVAFALFVTWYPRKRDLFPSPGAFKPAGGIALGFTFDQPQENILIGGVFEPTLGVQIIGGYHRGRLSVLQDGLNVDDVLPPGTSELPTRQEWDDAIFLSVAFDINIFTRLFGGG